MITDPQILTQLSKLVFVDNVPVKEVVSKLRVLGYDITEKEVYSFQTKAISSFESTNGPKIHLLDSIDEIKEGFQDLVDRTKSVMDRAEKTKDDRLLLEAIAEYRSQLTLALKRLGELTDKITNITNIKAEGNVGIIQNLTTSISEMLLVMQAEENDGRIILNNPTPELLMDLRRAKNKM